MKEQIKKTTEEPIDVGLSIGSHTYLKRFKDEKIFHEMRDGYRFAISYALNKGVKPPTIDGEKKTTFNIGTLDPTGEIKQAIVVLNPDLEGPIYKYAEHLAEWGMREFIKMYKKNQRLDLVEIVKKCS
jgi:hypothetical protein